MRYFDIRCGFNKGQLVLYHADVLVQPGKNLDHTCTEIIDSFTRDGGKHSREFVFIQIKPEGGG